MATRFNNKGQSRFGVPPLPTGYDSQSSPTLTIPPVGVEDVDVSLFRLFDNEIGFTTSHSKDGSGELRKVPVIFASGEKWALAKRKKALRDRNDSLILPLITVVRTSIQQSPQADITGRGINQQTGEIVIKRRLDKSDRGYQNLINKALIGHQANLSVTPTAADEGQASTTRGVGDLSTTYPQADGGLLATDNRDNVFEIIVVPAPQFFTAMYEVTFWVQYNIQLVQMLETLMSSFLPQANSWRLDTAKGYWFVAKVDENVFNADNNFDDMSQEERHIAYKFNVSVPAYVLASMRPGSPVPLKRYVSAPVLSFDVSTEADSSEGTGIEGPFLGADDPTLPMTTERSRRRDRRDTNGTLLYNHTNNHSDDPAVRSLGRNGRPGLFRNVSGVDNTGKRVTRLVKVSSSNSTMGESTFSVASLGGIELVVANDVD